MEEWILEKAYLISNSTSKDIVSCHLQEAAELLEFEHFAYGIMAYSRLSDPKFALENNYSSKWQETYQANGFLHCDPTIKQGMLTTKPIIWSDQLFSESRDLWEEAQAHGLKHGWAKSVKSLPGVSGLITFSRSSSALTEQEISFKSAKLIWLSELAHAKYEELLLPSLLPDTAISLTRREREVIVWTAEGKTSHEISRILGIAERTVNFHINNAIEKLDVNNKTAAVAKAINLGLTSF